MGVPAGGIDLIPPIGTGAGLPFTIVWADDLTDAGGAGTEQYALFDTNLWANRMTTNQAKSPLAWGGATSSTTRGSDFDPAQIHFQGLTMANTPPALNFATGSLESGQAVQDIGRGRHDASHLKCFYPASKTSVSDVGRHLSHKRTGYTSPRAGNHTWQIHKGQSDRMMASYDYQIGSQVATTSNSQVQSLTHMSKVDLPSNGAGETYGDNHHTTFLSALWSAPVSTMVTATGLDNGLINNDPLTFPAHWGLNLMVEHPVIEGGKSVSATDATNTATGHSLADQQLLNLPPETTQTILVKDKHNDKATHGNTEDTFVLGRTDLGNHVVADTCGLIGYEGVVSATAFLSVSRSSNPPQAQAPPSSPLIPDRQWNEDGAGMFAGLNIQVHSGTTFRRNGLSYSIGASQLFRYGSDGTFVEPMTEGMSTTGLRSSFKGETFTENANETRFHTGRVNGTTNGAISNDLSAVGYNASDINGNALTGLQAVSKPASRYILGDHVGEGANWTHTVQLSQHFLKDRIPTKVRVVPVLVDTVPTDVTAGASHPSSGSITFNKPIVDYHVLVSLSPKTRINATVDLDSTDIGTPSNRNFPQTKRLTANMDLEDEGCEIYHAIFRIDPTLERVYFDSSDTTAISEHGALPSDNEMPNSVMPRHDSENGGWNLHQLTPFRPIANASWSQIPLLCATIEAGGFYQRGGISHLWDADAYGEELFVGADAIDANHFNAETWGTGQVWADGVGDLAYPRGSELMIFKYNPAIDPYYTRIATSVTNNPLYRIDSTYITTKKFQDSEILTVTKALLPEYNQYDGWSIHDWVFPQIELMRFLGREDKANARHPRHSENTGGDPIYHPTLHCSSLRFMQDGKMAMATIHRDYIGSEEEYPDADIAYPFNPDAGSGSGCPAGYYRSGDQCVPITSGDNPNTGDSHQDPITGEVIPSPPPSPTNGSGSSHQGGGDNFDLLPSWSRIVTNTSGRSLILMWSDIPANNGKAVAGRRMFDARKIRVDGEDYYTQNWTHKDSWWSGSRISYWYSESGQRAIPMTYGSYPEVRCSYANLPRALPHLYTSGIKHGYPTQQPVNQIGLTLTGGGLATWAVERADFLKRTFFVPTTIGFADYGASANPHQELGWSGWSFPRGLYDPIGYGNNTQFFSDAPEALGQPMGTAIVPSSQGQWEGFLVGASNNYGLMKGPMSVFSHHGPLHYGITTTHHPFKPTRTWKQVHGGVGYDVPIHLLAPAEVHVRARAGGRNSLDLEMETPFHRTDVQHIEPATAFNTGFDLGGKANPASTRTPLGQYYLRTNLWDDASRTHASNAKVGGLEPIGDEEGRGPIVSGNGLFAFWNDHPTEHFHAGAVPLMPKSDYDIAVIENERYAPMILGRIDEINDVDYVAVAEQLQSSVDVHVSSVTRPMWDSGSIVSARGTGERDSTNTSKVSHKRSEMSGDVLRTSAESILSTYKDNGFGKGQRILRTDDGTLHSFCIERSATGTGGNRPTFVHYTKPLHNDLFWNRKAQRVNPSNAEYTGHDEVGPEIGASDVLRSATFTSDSLGTIHAVIEIEEATRSPKHTLYYAYAKRKLVSYNPSPVYEWTWDTAPVAIPNSSGASGKYDLRQPSIACDSNDRVHLACRQVVTDGNSHIIYTTKLPSETNFIDLPPFTLDPKDWGDDRWSKVNKTTTVPYESAENTASSTNHAVRDCDAPKVCLIGDNTPLVFFRGGIDAGSGTFGDRHNDAIYANIGRNDTGAFDPSGRYRFDPAKAIHVVGIHNADQFPTTNVIYYDAVIDENDRAFVTVIKDNDGRSVLVNSFDASKPFSDQYTTADGLGITKALFIPKNVTVRPDYKHITTTVNGQGQVHMILAFTLKGQDDDRGLGGLYRDGTTEATIAPLQWATTPAGDSTVSPPSAKSAGGGYDKPDPSNTSFEWPDGGTFLTPLTGQVTHFMEVWMPTFEFDISASADDVIRSINIRWLSVPSMNYDSTNGWHPVGSAQSMNGHEDFTHTNPQLRYQRFWGFDAGELDLKWATNELAWMNTFHRGSQLYYPYLGGSFTTVGEGDTDGDGIAGWPI